MPIDPDIDPDAIPKAQDRATGERGDLGVWPDDVALKPAPVWNGDPAIFAYVTHVTLLEHLDAGDEFALIGKDRALRCTVNEVDWGDQE